MNSRKLFALLMVFALTGSALAAQQNMYLNTDHKAKDVSAVQQHSVFVEIVVEEQQKREQIHEFAAVVGLVKKCKQVRNVFDNAVLWFNDQFLFGDKKNNTVNETPPSALGENPNNSSAKQNPDAFVRRSGTDTRWGGCFIPDGFMHAIGQDDPYGVGAIGAEASNDEANASAETNETDSDRTTTANGDEVATGCGFCDRHKTDAIDVVRNLIDLDNECNGCIFEYQSTFFVTDPNDHQWMVDKLVYPTSFEGNVFGENRQTDHCANDENATTPTSDPRDNYEHQDRCRDTPQNGSAENHCDDNSDGERCRGDNSGFFGREVIGHENSPGEIFTAVEPIFTVKVQVDPESPYDSGFADEAQWQYRSGEVRDGMPYPDDPSHGNYEYCKQNLGDESCAIEYNFMLAVDFAAFDDTVHPEAQEREGNTSSEAYASGPNEDEIESSSVQHGQGGANETDKARDGNSHPHNPNTTTPSPKHSHDAVNLDLFFYSSAPYFVEANPYWDDFGAPPIVDKDCAKVLEPSANADNSTAEDQRSAVHNRAPIVCDVTAQSGFHAHDGSQTPRPG